MSTTTYHKIPGPFLRDPATRKLTDMWSTPELAALKDSSFNMYEKIDGTNIRVMWDGYKVTFGGRTDRAIIPSGLLEYLEEVFGGSDAESLFEQTYGSAPVTLYGEGVGPKINGGNKYSREPKFILFDVMVQGYFGLRDAVERAAEIFGVPVAPCIVEAGTLEDGIGEVRKGLMSQFGDFYAEGLVAVTTTGLLTRFGERVIVKLKHCDLYVQP